MKHQKVAVIIWTIDPVGKIKVYWKKNKITGRRDNPNYLG